MPRLMTQIAALGAATSVAYAQGWEEPHDWPEGGYTPLVSREYEYSERPYKVSSSRPLFLAATETVHVDACCAVSNRSTLSSPAEALNGATTTALLRPEGKLPQTEH